MPPRLRLCRQCLRNLQLRPFSEPRYLATASAVTPAAPLSQTTTSPPPIARFPPTQPPSHKPPEFRKSQLHRQYTSLLRSTPLLLLFQHSNLRSPEWMSIRRELVIALENTDEQLSTTLAPSIKLQAIQAGIFESALRVAEYYRPPSPSSASTSKTPSRAPEPHPTAPSTQSSASIPNLTPSPINPNLTHALSRHAHAAVSPLKNKHPLTPLLSGPLALLTFPTVSPQHLKAALQILAPDKSAGFAPPTRRMHPGFYDGAVQGGLQKLMLLGARVDGRVFDQLGVRWVGGLEGMDGLRAQLVALLGGAGVNLVRTLGTAGQSLWMTMEGRRGMLEEEEKKGEMGES
ncbi:MAG: hypothetical protein Q9217_000974 [Psora testacea]